MAKYGPVETKDDDDQKTKPNFPQQPSLSLSKSISKLNILKSMKSKRSLKKLRKEKSVSNYCLPHIEPEKSALRLKNLDTARKNKIYPKYEDIQKGIIHQIWIQGEQHLKENRPHFYENFLNYKKINNNKNCLWSEDMIESLIVNEYPKLLTLYHSYSHFIMRVDLAKYIILHYYGGCYVDMDSECRLNFGGLQDMTDDKPLVCEVTDDYRTKVYATTFINNHFLYLPTRRHEFMDVMLEEAPITAKRRLLEPMILYILRAVGPGFLMHCISKYKKKKQKKYNKTDKKIFHKKFKTEDVVTVIDSKILNTYFFHESKNTWLEDQWMDKKDEDDYSKILTVILMIFGISFAWCL